VYAEGKKRDGFVEHVSTTLCPGGVQVRFKGDAEKDGQILVPPWRFADLLRPALQEPLGIDRSIITMDDQHGKQEPESEKLTTQRASSSRKKRFAPQVTKSQCKPSGCCVQ